MCPLYVNVIVSPSADIILLRYHDEGKLFAPCIIELYEPVVVSVNPVPPNINLVQFSNIAVNVLFGKSAINLVLL